MGSFGNRVFRAAKLDRGLYEEVEADKGAIRQALLVVFLYGISAGFGSISKAGLGGIFMTIVMALVGWVIWAFITYMVGTNLLPEPQTKSDYGELLRTIGFANSPGLIGVFGIIPGLMGPVFLVTTVWMLVATVVAVKQALDYQSTFRAVGVCVIALIVQLLFSAFLAFIFGGVGGTGYAA